MYVEMLECMLVDIEGLAMDMSCTNHSNLIAMKSLHSLVTGTQHTLFHALVQLREWKEEVPL